MQGFIEGFLSKLGEYFPSVIGALIILLLGWLLAVGIRKCLALVLKKIRVDQRLESKSGEHLAVEPLICGLVYYLVLLFALLLALGALGIEGVLDPLKNLIQGFVVIIPNLVAAVVIGVVGYVIARIFANAILVVGKGLDKLAVRAGISEKVQLARLVSQIVFVLVFVPILISALGVLGIEVISEPATEMLGVFMDAIPNIFAAALILAVAYVLGRWLTNILREVLESLGADSWPAKLGAGGLLGPERHFSRFCAQVAFFFILLAAGVSAVEKLNIDLLAGALGDLLVFAGQVLLGLVILLIGNYLATLAYQALSRSPERTGLATIVRYAILALVVAMGLKAMGIADDIVQLAFGLALGAVAVALALAYGLGGREAAGRHMEHCLSRFRGKAEEKGE
jgi:hypothetical protein